MERVEIKNVGKRFRDTWVLREVNASFTSGQIYGLIGQNGSGKTMLMKCICGLCRPTEGSIFVNGEEVGVTIDVPDSIGAIIEVPGFLSHLSGYANLRYLARLKCTIDEQKIREAILRVGLDPDSRKCVGKYSLGMRQRLGIAQAIMEDPEILLLDEPMNGLDQQGVNDAKELLLELRSQGKTIVLASHHAEDINELCDSVYQMDNGRLIRIEG